MVPVGCGVSLEPVAAGDVSNPVVPVFFVEVADVVWIVEEGSEAVRMVLEVLANVDTGGVSVTGAGVVTPEETGGELV